LVETTNQFSHYQLRFGGWRDPPKIDAFLIFFVDETVPETSHGGDRIPNSRVVHETPMLKHVEIDTWSIYIYI